MRRKVAPPRDEIYVDCGRSFEVARRRERRERCSCRGLSYFAAIRARSRRYFFDFERFGRRDMLSFATCDAAGQRAAAMSRGAEASRRAGARPFARLALACRLFAAARRNFASPCAFQASDTAPRRHAPPCHALANYYDVIFQDFFWLDEGCLKHFTRRRRGSRRDLAEPR